MSRSISLSLLLLFSGDLHAGEVYPGVGRPATPAEIAAWDIDVRPDFTGLPKGSGSAKKGEEVWEAKCASCHGAFGESNAVFPPIAGGTTREDIEKGRVAALTRGEQRTTLMKLSQVSALWDYVNRAMPWNAPKTLSVEEVYALTAYILALGNIVPDDFVLTEANIGEVQKRLPNRNGMSHAHGLWAVGGKPDVENTACMKNCAGEVRVTSRLPESSGGAHGEFAAQNRLVGPARAVAAAASAPVNPARELAATSGCLGCHGASVRVVGPSLAEIADRYRTDSGAEARLAAKVLQGGQGAWGQVPMPPHPQLRESQARTLVRWILTSD